jgi:hypothetical protein
MVHTARGSGISVLRLLPPEQLSESTSLADETTVALPPRSSNIAVVVERLKL